MQQNLTLTLVLRHFSTCLLLVCNDVATWNIYREHIKEDLKLVAFLQKEVVQAKDAVISSAVAR